ncbi:MAG: metallophosphoesterase, partial [Blastopirellula sp. JB062]
SINEFLWESTTSTPFLNWLAERHQADLILATHTGIHWGRAIEKGRAFVNVGALGRPANNGHPHVWYTIISIEDHGRIQWEFVPVEYDVERLIREMQAERLPAEFIETIRTGWWTTCLEILPAKERRRGRH